MIRLLLSTATFVVGLGAAHAAKFDTSQMNGWPVIRMIGAVEPGDDAKFAALAKVAGEQAIVDLDMHGGALFPAIMIVEFIHDHHYWTFVKKDEGCSGACTVIFIGGVRHWAEHWETVIYDGDYTSEDGDSVLLDAYYNKVGAPSGSVGAEDVAGGPIVAVPTNPHPPARSFFFVRPDDVFNGQARSAKAVQNLTPTPTAPIKDPAPTPDREGSAIPQAPLDGQ